MANLSIPSVRIEPMPFETTPDRESVDFDAEIASDNSVPGFMEGSPFLFPLNGGTINIRPWPTLTPQFVACFTFG